ncbi:hypothetical protein [uncultured Tateyamaria sp.]|uniref:hypothetical protein n=1 Tax=uncultured Tateyamaria sp. TaxID=455651 RepID=UPI002623CAD1|nr:hypothetical protein [uncultured Tateyamaria sp.]
MFHLVSRRLHAAMDYPLALGLIVMPFAFGIGMGDALPFALSFGAGLLLLLVTSLTDHEAGVLPAISFRAHRIIDGIIGAVFVAAPLGFGFSSGDTLYYLTVGLTILAVVSAHRDPAPALAAAE